MYFQIKNKIEEQTLSVILDALQTRCTHISKRNLVTSLQFKFFQRKQNPSKPFDNFYTELLNELIKHCQFKYAVKQLKCTRTLLGIQNKESKQKLL